jgi:hypothetical protein
MMRSSSLLCLPLLMAFASLMHATPAAAQTSAPLLFTVLQPDTSQKVGDGETTSAVGERGLLLFQDASFDPGISAEARSSRSLVVRSSIGTVDLAAGGQHIRSFQQIELLRPIRTSGKVQFAIGGGVRQEWGGAQTFVGRIIAGARVARGRLAGNAVIEKAVSGIGHRDQFDVITTVGWSRAVTDRIALGVEGIGQDLEGFWERDEAEGGARLLIGPSLHVASPQKRWSVTVAGGPLLHSTSTIETTTAPRDIQNTSTRSHFAVLGSLTYVLSQ